MVADFTTTLDRPVAGSGSLTVTGLESGRYYFRVGSGDGGWSETVEVVVAHHSLPRAFGFFALGLALFGILCLSILTGHARMRRSSHGS